LAIVNTLVSKAVEGKIVPDGVLASLQKN